MVHQTLASMTPLSLLFVFLFGPSATSFRNVSPAFHHVLKRSPFLNQDSKSRLLKTCDVLNIRRSGLCQDLNMAGFGSPDGPKGQKNKKASAAKKLKPKAQWDRYDALKNDAPVSVAVRVLNKGETGEWLEVGRVKSEGSRFTEVSVGRQRSLIAEVLPKDRVEWAYCQEGEEEWITVSKDVLDNAPSGIEKKIGFEGLPDPKTGFYCHYHEGRLVDKDDKKKVVPKDR